MEPYFETQLLLLHTIDTADLSDEELRQLLAPTSTVLIDAGKWIAARLGRQFSKWGSWLERSATSMPQI